MWGAAVDASSPTLFPEMQRDAPMHTTGILPSQRIEDFIASRQITARVPIQPTQVQPASLDLRLGEVAYRVRASFFPGRTTVAQRIDALKLHEISLTDGAVL